MWGFKIRIPRLEHMKLVGRSLDPFDMMYASLKLQLIAKSFFSYFGYLTCVLRMPHVSTYRFRLRTPVS